MARGLMSSCCLTVRPISLTLHLQQMSSDLALKHSLELNDEAIIDGQKVKGQIDIDL